MTIFHYLNGKIVPESEACISVLDLGLLRGYGVFDYVQLYMGRPFHMRAHIERLFQSAKQIQLDVPLSIEELEAAAWDLIEINEPIDAGIRFVITGGISGKDLLLPKFAPSLFILFHPTNPYKMEYYQKGMRVITVSIPRYLPHVKTTNYMPAIFAMKKAVEAQVDDALYLNEEKGIVEGTTCNVFFVKNGMLITDNSNQLVRGVTRDVILNLAQGIYPIEYRALSLDEVASCDEAFLTSSIKDLIPLVQVDNQKVGSGLPGPITANLRSLFHNYIDSYLSLTKVTA